MEMKWPRCVARQNNCSRPQTMTNIFLLTAIQALRTVALLLKNTFAAVRERAPLECKIKPLQDAYSYPVSRQYAENFVVVPRRQPMQLFVASVSGQCSFDQDR